MTDPFAEALSWLPDDLADARKRLDVLARRLEEAALDASDVCRCRELLDRVAGDVLPLCADAPPANKPRPDDPALLTSDQVIDRLCISKRTLFRLVAARKFPQPVRYNRKLVRWRAADVTAALASLS